MTTSVAELLSIVAAPNEALIVKGPVPGAVGLLSESLPPPLNVSPPLQALFAPVSVSVSVSDAPAV